MRQLFSTEDPFALRVERAMNSVQIPARFVHDR